MRKSLIPVIMIVAVAALCLSAAFAGETDQTGEREATHPFGAAMYVVDGTVTEEGSSPVTYIEGATVTLSSETSIVSTTTDASGDYTLSVAEGTYKLTVSIVDYVTYVEKDIVVSADIHDKDVSLKEKTNVNGATVTGYVMALDDFGRYVVSTSDSIKLYYRTSETETTVPSDYVELQYTTSINVATGTFKIEHVKYAADPHKDTSVDRCYIGFSIANYSISNVSSSCIKNEVEFIGGQTTVLYHLNKAISETGSFEDNESYSLGSSSSAGFIFSPVDGTVKGTVTDDTTSDPVSGATITLSSETGVVSTTTNSSGKYLMYVTPGKYDLTITKEGFVTYIEDDIVIGSNITKDVSVKEKTNVNGSKLTGYFMSLDEAISSDTTINIKLYYRTTETESSKLSDYAEMQSTSTIKSGTILNGTFEISGIKYIDPAYPTKVQDTQIDRCYLMIAIDTYRVESVSSTYFTGEKVFTDTTTGVITTLYHLNDIISNTGSFEDNESYSIGNSASSGIVLRHAVGVVHGTMNTIGTVTITDSSGKLYGQGSADSNGNYSVETYVGKNLTIEYSSIGYKSVSTTTVTVYNESIYSHEKNKQDAVKLTEIETGKAYVKFYIDGKTSSITDIDKGKFVLYQLLNPSEVDPSKRNYRAICEYTSELKKDVIKDVVTGYYFDFNINGNIKCEDCFLSIQISGYSVRMVQSEYMEMTPTIITSDDVSSNQLKSAISTNGRFETGHEYSVGTCSSDAILIDSATGTVKGQVLTNTESPTILNGVKVSIIDKDDNSTVAYGITSNNGSYSITVATGEYKIRYEIEGYVTYETTLKVYDESEFDPEKNRQPDVKLDAEKGEWFGMDLPHALLVLGGIIAVILICAVLFHRFRILDKKNKVIYEDEDEDERN